LNSLREHTAGKIPYIVHPLGVAKTLIEYGCPEHVIVAGILHDTVEDTPVTLNEIKETFGWHVAELVGAASETDKADTWENRKNHTVEMLKILSEEALILVLADKMDNIRAIERTTKDTERISGADLDVRENSRSGTMRAWQRPLQIG